MTPAILIALLNTWYVFAFSKGEQWGVAEQSKAPINIHDGRWLESGHFQNLLFIIIYRISTSRLTKTNALCDWKRRVEREGASLFVGIPQDIWSNDQIWEDSLLIL